MKRISIIILTTALVALLFSSALPVMAAKPSQVITVSNGFPSGFHFNLNIHGKNPDTFTTPSPPPYDPPYGNSIFIPEFTEPYGPITIECISEKKGGVTELEVIDPYAMPTSYSNGDPTNLENADDLAQFNLPYKIQTDAGLVNANGYYVYGRILGKPNNSAKKDGDPSSSIIVDPNPVIQYDTDGAELPLGLITTQGSYKVDSQEFVRFDDTSSLPNGNGKGRSIAKNITDMFMWTGWVYDGSLDINEDGVVDFNDVPAAYDTEPYGEITQEEFDNWLADMAALGLARYYEDWWVFDVAELVIQSWNIENDGTKLLQIRFYPVATTEFTEKAHIVVKKITDPTDDTTTLFDFEASYRNPWQMTSEQFCLSYGLDAGSYSVTELAEDGWDLTEIRIEDPTDGGNPADDSSYDLDQREAYINLVEGETVIVTFVNTQRGQLIVDKVTDPAGALQEFDFTLTGGPDIINQGFTLADGTTPYESGAIKPGTYSVTEILPLPDYWSLTSAVCSDGSNPSTIDLDPGEVVTVVFTNTYTAP